MPRKMSIEEARAALRALVIPPTKQETQRLEDRLRVIQDEAKLLRHRLKMQRKSI